MEEPLTSRRPLTSRDTPWAQRFARWLKDHGVRPNFISVMSVNFAGLAALMLIGSTIAMPGQRVLRILFLIGVVVGVLGRLLCNLFDGMVAVEGGLKTPTGELFNDLPDRLSDFVIFVALGIAASASSAHDAFWISAGWLAATLAILTAYIRYLGAGCGVGHTFIGPMAKQHRMATTIAAVAASAILEPWLILPGTCFQAALIVLIVGTAITCVRRINLIARKLNEKAASPS